VKNEKIIGIVGGVGPYAGLDLAKKILDQTKANSDQDYLSVALLSLPAKIEDRTLFLLGKAKSNPVTQTAKNKLPEVIDHLEGCGAEAVILGCTEFPLAIPEQKIGQVSIIDPTVILARALVRQCAAAKLKPL